MYLKKQLTPTIQTYKKNHILTYEHIDPQVIKKRDKLSQRVYKKAYHTRLAALDEQIDYFLYGQTDYSQDTNGCLIF